MNYYLTFDIGTTSVKSCIFDSSMKLISYAKKEYTLEATGNFVELSPEVYTAAICDCVKDMHINVPVSAISITTQGETLLPVDREGRPLRKAIVWLDSRAEKQAKKLQGFLDSQTFYESTGLPEISSALPLTKLMWLKENEPDIWESTYKILLLEDYIIYWLSGKMLTEKSLATSTGWFDIINDDYWNQILERTGIESCKLPDMVECGQIIGNILPFRAAELGLNEDIQIVSGAMDQTAAAFAAGCTKPGYVSETTGTAMVAAAFTENPVFIKGHHLTIYRSIFPKTYIYLPICNTAGMCLKWLRDNVFTGAGSDEVTYASLDELAEKSGPGANGVLFLPYLSGEIDPENIENATATFFGLRLSTGRGDLTRAVLESIAYQLKDFIYMLKELNCPVSHICSLGGGAYSPLWLRIKSDVCGLRINTLNTNEATSLGVAALALKAIEGKDIPPATHKDTYEPCFEFSDTYDKCYRKYSKLSAALKNVY